MANRISLVSEKKFVRNASNYTIRENCVPRKFGAIRYIYICTCLICLKYEWNDLVRNFFAVQFPEFSVLFGAAFIVTYGAMCEQYDQERDVEVRDQARKEGGDGPTEGSHDFWDVVKMT